MKNFWIRMNMKWSREELSGWNSFQKAVYLLWPLLVYFIVHDAAEILLWAAVNAGFAGSEELTAFLQRNAATFRGVINGLAILSGVAVIRKAIWREIAGADKGITGRTQDRKAEGVSVKVSCNKTNEVSDAAPENSASLVTRYFVLAAIGFFSALGLNILMNLFGLTAVSESYENTAQAQYSVNFAAGLFLYGVVSPVAEEAVFRGMIYNRMKRCFGYAIALCVSSLIFGCYHGNFVQALYGTLLGLLIAWCYEKCGSFVAPVLVHAVANVSMYVMTYYGGLDGMSRPVSIGVAAVSLLGAGGFLLYLWRIEKNRNILQI